MKEILNKLYNREDLSENEMKKMSNAMLSGVLSEAQTAAFLIALKIKGETIQEIAALSSTMLQKCVHFECSLDGIMDNCGTGGDHSCSFNVSTTSAFVLASAGIPIAKHGNRSISSKSGSADVCNYLGIPMDQTPEESAEQLSDLGITFIFAPYAHPAMKNVMKVRQALQTPTIFNIIGPIINPFSPEKQLMGLNRRELLEPVAYVLKKLGRKRAVVINGSDFMDEASLHGENHYALLDNGEVSSHTFTSKDVGLPSYSLESIRGGEAKENAQILIDVLKGKESPAYYTTLLNSGLGIYASGKADSIQKGISIAKEKIHSGAAYHKLVQLQEYKKGA